MKKFQEFFENKYEGDFLTKEILEDFCSIFERYEMKIEYNYYRNRDSREESTIWEIKTSKKTSNYLEFMKNVIECTDTLEQLLTKNYKLEVDLRDNQYTHDELICVGKYGILHIDLKITYVEK